MASSIINSDDGLVSGTSGIKTTGGDDGSLKIQANGVDAINIASNGTVALSAGALPVSSGGTGQTTYTNGQLLIGNTTGNTLTKATLTAGSGVTITNGTGSITIAASGGGDVAGPASSTDNAIARFNSTTGKIIQNSGVTIDDSNNVAGVVSLAASNEIYTTGTGGTTVVECGRGTGSVALTVNDGYGNANLAFNHRNGTPDVTGSSSRIVTSVDSSAASLNFQLGNSTTSGVAVGLTEVGGFDTSFNFKFNSGYGSSAIAYGCRAWVNFNGTGTVAIRASGNVSSITDRNTGAYTVNFTTAFPNANYSAVGTASRSGAETQLVVSISTAVAPTTGAVAIQTYRTSDAGVEDSPNVNIAVFR